MKSRWNIFFILILLFSCPFSSNADEIRLVADPWMPYNGSEENNPGYLIDIARAVFEKNGHTVIYEQVPWTRAIEKTRKGAANGIVCAYQGDPPDFVFPENHLGYSINKLYVRKESKWRYENTASLEALLFGVLKNYGSRIDTIENYILANEKNPRRIFMIYDIDSLDIFIKKLLEKKIDVFMNDKRVMDYYALGQNGLFDKIREVNIPEEYPHLLNIAFTPAAVNPKSVQYAKALSEGITDLRNSGRLKKILNKYSIEDWVK